MARVVRRAASASARRAPSRAVHRRARRHKVIMESVTQEKKKLRSIISFEAQAPSGYTFIPAGNPHITTACKERCRKEGLDIFAVSTTPHMHIHNLSQHVHRIGYHFPSTVVAVACSELGLYLTNTGKAVPIHGIGTTENLARANSESQITINTEARDAIRDLFPNIPDKDLNQIIKTAFQKGQRKVGTASELPLARRAQLAVVAHIRHLYTDYDRLLKTTSFHEARTAVEQTTLAKVIEWRGDDENGQTVLEDVFREVIVISDDEDSETEEDMAPAICNRELSVEVLSRNARGDEIQTQPVTNLKSFIQDPSRELSEEAPPGFRFVPRMPAKNTIDRRGFSRYQAWNRALHRYRAGAHGAEQSRFGSTLAEDCSPRHATRHVAVPKSTDSTRRPHAEVSPRVIPGPANIDNQVHRVLPVPVMDRRPSERPVGVPEIHIASTGQRKLPNHGFNARPGLTTMDPREVHSAEGGRTKNGNVVYSQGLPSTEKGFDPRTERPPVSSDVIANAPVFVSGPKEQYRSNEGSCGHRPEPVIPHASRSGLNPQEYVLPSIENPWPSDNRHVDGRLEHLTKRMTLRSVTPGCSQRNAIELDSPSDQTSKRRRLAYHGVARRDTGPDPRSARPIGLSVSEGLEPRGQYRRVQFVPEHRPQDEVAFHQDYPPPGEQPPLVGYRERNPEFCALPPLINLDTRPTLERKRTCDILEHVPHPHPGLPGASFMGLEGDRAFRAAPDVSNPGGRHVYHGNRSPRLNGAWLGREEPRASTWRNHIDGGRLADDLPPSRKLYADGFVRAVGARESRPIEYARPSRPEGLRAGESRGQPRTRAPDELPLVQPLSAQQGLLPLGMRGTRAPLDHIPSHLEAVPGNPQPVSTAPVHRDRRMGGLEPPWHFHDPHPRPVEPNRPVYVKRVEPHPPYSVADGRPVIVVD
ncbi:hypothetical protein NUU61_007619 [Penicillium alfredii]|uniref:DUF2293 domain-containing protein n=1 Tax=Penicillium alfredii TaxID=1506179 RepID=A0A9W9JZ63_9EURO|nr:uncharacterized protein NUU61_007619 [Penicillium alfredii]KAJ5086312.1 hypothetical protein NUU61_007619 [Penicillium alfredii]